MPERNSIVLPEMKPDEPALPLSSARVFVHLFLIEDGEPTFVHEIDAWWPEDEMRTFKVDPGKNEITFQLETVEARTQEPSAWEPEPSRRPYLYISGRGQVHRSRMFGGGSSGFGGVYIDGKQQASFGLIDRRAVVAILSPCLPFDPVKELTLREFVRSRWNDIGPQVEPARIAGRPEPAVDPTRKAFSAIAGEELPETHGHEARWAAYERRLREAGGTLASGAGFKKVGLVDLDTSTVLNFDSPPKTWPQGIDVMYDESTRRWTPRPGSSVRVMTLSAPRDEFQALREAGGKTAELDASSDIFAHSVPFVRTDQGNRFVIVQTGNGTSVPLIGERRTFSSFQWFLLSPKKAPAKKTGYGDPPNPRTAAEHENLSQDPEWPARFEAVYLLKEGEILKRIPPPFIPERVLFYAREFPSQAKAVSHAPDFFIWRQAADGLSMASYGFGMKALSLSRVLNQIPGVMRSDYEISQDLLSKPIPGDWVYRPGADRAELLLALDTILSEAWGAPVRFELKSVERDVVLVSGRYIFSAEPDAPSDDHVHVYVDSMDTPDRPRRDGRYINDILPLLGDHTGVAFIPEGNLPRAFVRLEYHKSSSAEMIANDPARLDLLLKNLERQTGLNYRRERRQVEVWTLVEE